MKILHLCLASFYIDGFSYQENLLPKFHKKMGYDVEIIASLVTFDKNGNIAILDNGYSEYVNENGIKVTRLEYKDGKIYSKLRRYKNTLSKINQAKPDIIFIHGCQFMDIDQVIEYAKENTEVKIYVDNHADFSNSATNWVSKNVLHKVIWKRCAQMIEPYTEKFYGVLPARVDFLKSMYKLPPEKVELLVMGADDEKVNESNRNEVVIETREKYGINESDFLIVTGGKIDLAKKQVLNLMQVVDSLDNPDVKLIVYGSVVEELQDSVDELLQSNSIKHIGWIDDAQSYDLFSASDLIVFPGRHSVYWEQAVAMGKPIVVKEWEGTTHINIGGNCIFLNKDTFEELDNIINTIISDSNTYKEMLNNAQKEEKNKFLYSRIAQESLNR